nr:hypothetical protein [uncultured Chryseobacterium sp.]
MGAFENQNKNNIENIILKTEKVGMEFIEIISIDEVDNCKKSFTELFFGEESSPQPLDVMKLNYQHFCDLVNCDNSRFCKFYPLPENRNFMTWGLTFSDTDDLKQSVDKFYILIDKRFIGQNFSINQLRTSSTFTTFKETMINATSNNNCTEMILYERQMIVDYLAFMKVLANLTNSEIMELEFHHIYFKDFERKDGALLNYKGPKENRISFAVKTNFNVNEKTNRNLQDLLKAYYNAGDLKP